MKIKSLWLIGLITLVILVYAACSSAPEKTLLDKYFHAVSMKDNQTMAAMAWKPLEIDYASFQILETSPEQIEPVSLPALNEKEAEAKKKVDDHIGPVVDAKDELDAAKDELDNARTLAARAALKKKVEQLQAKYDEEYNIHKELQKMYGEAKDAAAKEEQITLFSLGLKSLPGVRSLNGDIHIKNLVISVKNKAGTERKYKVELRKYVLKDETGKVAYNGQWKIIDFVPVS
ncbi:MAG: hypothetical protein H5U05_02235 [Candidatus Aminicenantes bacterium]|nr:hypothetical protein [Candidatus Aminicenantes bacterium]